MKNMTIAKDIKSAKPKKVAQRLPRGWTEAKVRAVVDHYDHLTDEQLAREIEEAVEVKDTTMSVPTELVPAIARLIQDHQRKAANGRADQRRPAKMASRRRRSAQS